MPRFFVPTAQIHGSRVLLTGAEFHHLRHVLRLNAGAHLTLCDEHGGEYQGIIAQLSPTSAAITITVSSAPVSTPFSLTLAQGLLKGQKMDLVIEKATELGVNRILPFVSAFTVAHLPPERHGERLARWQRLAHSAAKQSGSPVPLISPPQALGDLLTSVPQETGKVLLYEKERGQTLKAFAQTHPVCSSLCVVVGPEGGFAAQEVEQAQAAGFQVVNVGTFTLRAETAGIVATALCRFLWQDEGIPPLPSPQ
jgi:16S rRNA (uracil1498-N3)-methyltransferase